MPDDQKQCRAFFSEEASAPTVLVYEKNILSLKTVGEVIGAAGYAVLEASTPEIAKILVLANPKIDLFVTGVNAPGIDELELANWMRKQQPSMKVAVCGGFTLKYASLPNGPDAYLEKPLVPETLLRQVARLVPAPRYGAFR